MTTSPKLGLPFVDGQQNQPEVTLNKALVMLQALALGVIATQNAPPSSPSDGDSYIIGPTPTGTWAGRANKIATYYGGWLYIPGVDSDGAAIAMGAAQEGLTVFSVEANGLVTWNGAFWYGVGPASSD